MHVIHLNPVFYPLMSLTKINRHHHVYGSIYTPPGFSSLFIYIDQVSFVPLDRLVLLWGITVQICLSI